MKLAKLGLNHSVSLSATCHTVSPPSGAWSADHLSSAPPHDSTVRPKWRVYHAASSRAPDFDLKNTPPMPVTFAMAVDHTPPAHDDNELNRTRDEQRPQGEGTAVGPVSGARSWRGTEKPRWPKRSRDSGTSLATGVIASPVVTPAPSADQHPSLPSAPPDGHRSGSQGVTHDARDISVVGGGWS